MIAQSDPALLEADWGRRIYDVVSAGDGIEGYMMWMAAMSAVQDPFKGQEEAIARPAWQRITAAAEKYNEPGRFTAIIGFEWTAGPQGNNLHRNVLFRDGKERADQVIPISMYESSDPEDLWQWMADYEQLTGGRMLAIAHNGNLSNGLMFDDVTLTTAAEDNFFGKVALLEPTADPIRFDEVVIGRIPANRERKDQHLARRGR